MTHGTVDHYLGGCRNPECVAMKPEHGTAQTYRDGCRCDDCRTAWTAYNRVARARARARRELVQRATGKRYVAPNVKHGTYTAYRNSGCRCLPCSFAASERRREEKARAKDAA